MGFFGAERGEVGVVMEADLVQFDEHYLVQFDAPGSLAGSMADG